MTRPTATCELYVNDTRVPDTGQQLIAAEPTVLDGLSLTWGRDGQNEQPGPATCSFTILDRYAESDFLDRLHVGSPVALWAEGVVPDETGGGTYQQVMDDPSFDSYPLGQASPADESSPASRYFTADGHALGTVVDGGGGDHRLQTEPGALYADPAESLTMDIPPRRYARYQQTPDAWDDIPQQQRTDSAWRFSVTFRAMAGMRVEVGRVYWRVPWVTNPLPGGVVMRSAVTATGDWQTITWTGSYALATGTAAWVGLRVRVLDTVLATWSGQTGTWATDTRTWNQILGQGVQVQSASMQRPSSDQVIRVLTFSGAVTDVIATPYGNGDTLNLAVTAADLGSDLGNRVIGDEPWPVQSLATRADRVAELAGVPKTAQVRVRIDDPLGALQVSYRDIDAQPSYALLQDLAQTGGGVLWAATHAVTGPYLWIENPADRASLRELTISGSLITITGATDDVTILSACDLLEDPISWRQDTADVSTVVAVTWLEQGTDDEGKPTTTERTETVSDPTAVTTYGTRRLSISTELVNQADATSIANRALATARAVPWRIEGLTFDTDSTFQQLDTVDDASREIALLNLLDGTTRMGLAVTLVDMPDYAPRGSISDVYVEGGRYAFEGGAWTLALNATPSGGQGTSATWGEIDPAWLWSQWSPSVTWQDLYGVAA